MDKRFVVILIASCSLTSVALAGGGGAGGAGHPGNENDPGVVVGNGGRGHSALVMMDPGHIIGTDRKPDGMRQPRHLIVTSGDEGHHGPGGHHGPEGHHGNATAPGGGPGSTPR